jgi:uncharacterized protein YraI
MRSAKFIPLLLVIALLAAFIPLGVVGAQEESFTVPAGGLFVYTQPNGLNLIAVLSAGTIITVNRSDTQNGYTFVRLPNGQTGYAQLSGAAGTGTGSSGTPTGDSTTAPSGPTSDLIVQAQEFVNIRSAPTTRATPRLGQIPYGERAAALAFTANGNWMQINYNGLVGWVVTGFFVLVSGDPSRVPSTLPISFSLPPNSVLGGSNIAVPAQPPADIPASGTAVSLGVVNIRNEPNKDSERLGVVPDGATVTVLGFNTARTWIRIFYNGVYGWVSAGFFRVFAQ